MKTIVFFFLATLVATTSHAMRHPNLIRLYGDDDQSLEDSILSGSGACLYEQQVNCLSWRLAVETDNLNDWATIPSNCVQYVGNYMQRKQYIKDINLVAELAIKFAKSQTLTGDGKDIWVFGIEDTSFSTIPYYKRSDVQFGKYPFNKTAFNEWVAEGAQPALPAVMRVYKNVTQLGYKVVFISGLHEDQKNTVFANLISVGYTTVEDVILKGKEDYGLTDEEFKTKKRTELVEKGYRIIGNIGDQWSDLDGVNEGINIFKVPNPMYNVS